MQSLVSANRISQNLSIKNSKQLEDAKIYASAGLDDDGDVVVKIVNYSEKAVDFAIETGVKVGSTNCKEVAGQGPLDSNTLEKQPIKTATCFARQPAPRSQCLSRSGRSPSSLLRCQSELLCRSTPELWVALIDSVFYSLRVTYLLRTLPL